MWENGVLKYIYESEKKKKQKIKYRHTLYRPTQGCLTYLRPVKEMKKKNQENRHLTSEFNKHEKLGIYTRQQTDTSSH